MDNIKESKEYQLAKDWERAVNDYGFNPKRFAAAIPEMHPTLQQSLYTLHYGGTGVSTVHTK